MAAYAAKKPGPASEAIRNAEALFETKTVAEIREIESKSRRDIEEKKQQLRQLVGDSHRDLIDSADKIVAISSSCKLILSNIVSIQEGFASLALNVSAANASPVDKRDFAKKHEELHALGSRIKYLVDTPEMIWGCLDSRQYLEGAKRFLRARQVHELLQRSFPREMLARFPLLAHQWPLVLKFQKQIQDTVGAALNSPAGLTTDEVADALAALAALQGNDAQAMLQLFLGSRRHMVQGLLKAAKAGDGSLMTGSRVAEVLRQVAQQFQSSIAQVGDLFLGNTSGGSGASGAVDGSSLLQSKVQADELDSSELFFTYSSGSAATGQSAEVEAWAKTVQVLQRQLTALSSGEVEKSCGEWIKQVAADVEQACGDLLRSCTDASTLVEAEHAIRAAVSSWAPASGALLQRISPAAQMERAYSAAAAAAAAAAGTPPPAGAGYGDAHWDAWQMVCEWVLGAAVPVWQELFHAPFVKRAKELIEACFKEVSDNLEAPLKEALAAAAAAAPEDAGSVSSPSWPQMLAAASGADAPGEPGLVAPASSIFGSSGGAALSSHLRRMPSDGGLAQPVGFRQQVHLIRQQFDEQLQMVLEAVLQLIDAPTDDMHAGTSSGGSAPARRTNSSAQAGRKERAGRAAELEPYVQAKAVEAALAIANSLQARLDSLPAMSEGVAGAHVVEQALLIGRLCSVLAADTRMLAVLLGPPDAWPAALGKTPSGASGGTPRQGRVSAGSARLSLTYSGRTQHASSKLSTLTERFKAIAVSAYQSWARWAACSLAARLAAAVGADELLSTNTVPLSWLETLIAGEPDTGLSGLGLGEAAADMRFSLPACPSAAVLGFLMAACQETRRAGDHTIGLEALQLLEWELAGAAYKVYRQLLEPGSSSSRTISEKGVLQLLLDVRLLRDTLAGGRPHNPNSALPAAAAEPAPGAGRSSLPSLFDQDPEVVNALAARKREASGLETMLQDRLDPIDWATYEPYLWSNTQKYYQRVAVLLGTLIQLHRVHPEAAGRSFTSQDSNPLNVLHVAPRFQYLPISAPTTSAAAGNKAKPALSGGLQRTASGMMPAPAAAAAASHTSDLGANYSFADLGLGRSSNLAGSSDQGMGDAYGVGSSALSAIQARLQGGGLGTLGLMLGDKAAEMTAMAQQRFETIGDYLPTAGLGGGLLSSFTKSVSTKK